MPQIEVTRVKRRRWPRRRRSLNERFRVLLPGTANELGALTLKTLSPGSRARRALLRREALSGWAAASRRDFDLMLSRYSEDLTYEADPKLKTLGLKPTKEGREGLLESIEQMQEAWERWEFELDWLIDLGARVVTLGRWRFFGRTSGLELEQEFGQVMGLHRGLVVAERDFGTWDETLEAAGLDRSVIDFD